MGKSEGNKETKEKKHAGLHSYMYSSTPSLNLGTTDFPEQRFSDWFSDFVYV